MFGLFSIEQSNAQVTQEWVAIYSTPIYSNIANSIAVDNSGNVYVTGQADAGNFNSYDYATIKYNSSGIQQWVQRYNGPGQGNDYAYSIAVDRSGNVYVTGWSWGKGTNFDYATLKYNSSGILQWVQRYNGPVNNRDGANSMAIDDSGNVYVTGVSYRSGLGIYDDYTTIKYNSAGDSIWVRRYNGPGNWYDGANSIAVDGSGSVYVTGYSAIASGSNYDYATIKYNTGGDSIWVRRYNGPVNGYDYAYSIAVDGSSNVYVTGYSWGGGTNYDYATLKYNSSGAQQWVQRYNGTGNREDYTKSIAVDRLGNAYVTGVSYGSGTDSDYATIKYNSTGVQQWVQRYNGTGNSKDYARSMALDSSGNVYVTGWSVGIGTIYDYATIKYNTAGIQEWVQRYNGTENYFDGANSIVVDVSGNVYVTGSSATGAPLPYYRYATIKYSQMVGIQPISNEIPEEYNLFQNYPNPFNPNSKIKFQISKLSDVKLNVFDIRGREIIILVNEVLKPGTYEAEISGENYPSGIYFYRLQTEKYNQTLKMSLIK